MSTINSNQKPKILGLIAGNGRFPVVFAQAAKRKANVTIFAVGIKGDTSRELKKYVDKLFWVGPGELKKLLGMLKAGNISEVVMAGQVNPKNLFNKKIALDQDIKALLERVKDKKADTIFSAVAEKLQELGIQLIDSTIYLKDLMPPKGALTQRTPTPAEWDDIMFGKDIAKHIGHLDIGQTVCIKQKAILAIEALEGTDEAILRAGRLGNGNVTVVKVSKPQQDMRFDIPVIGMNTIKSLITAKACCLAIEAEKTLLLDREQCVAQANKKGICIIAV
ncbi:LpxI family protein [Candidatus Omnitrophota bacterium]